MTIPREIYLEPSHKQFLGDRCFTANGPPLDRDGQMDPLKRVQSHLRQNGHAIHTIDLWNGLAKGEYYSFGQLAYAKAAEAAGLRMRAYVLLEPPTNAGDFYRRLPELTRSFETVHLFNVHGNGYSLEGVDRSRLRPLRFPQPLHEVLPIWARRDRRSRLVVINANKRPWFRGRELYTTRVEAVAALSRHDAVDLYGQGWRRVLLGDRYTLRQFFWPQIRHYRALQRAYRGAVESKYAVLGQYEASLCLENCRMDGYVSEKIFDCFYAGTVPYYLGAPDVATLIPKNTFVDASRFESWADLWEHSKAMSTAEREEYRNAARAFIESDVFRRMFHDSLLRIVEA